MTDTKLDCAGADTDQQNEKGIEAQRRIIKEFYDTVEDVGLN